MLHSKYNRNNFYIKIKILVILFIVLLILFLISVGFLIHSNNKYKSLETLYNELYTKDPVVIEKVVEVEKEVEVPKIIYTPAEALSEEDFFLLCQLIYKEAGATYCSNLDRTLVGNVALNRLDCNYRGAKTLKEVIYSKSQYSTASSISSDEHVMVPMSSVLAAYRLALGNRYCPNNVIFQSQSKQGDGVWKKVGNHYYCYYNSIEINNDLLIKDF